MALPKLCFIVPEYNLQIATHFSYLYDFVRNISRDFDIFLILEKAHNYPDFDSGIKIYIQKFRFFPLRLMENFLVFFYARLTGYRDFYIHYSFLSAFNASLIAKIGKGRVFYWNCGLPWLYGRSFFRERFERLVYRLVTFLVTGTEGLKKEYARHYRLPLSKIKVLPNWIDLEKIKNQKSKIKNLELRKKLNIPEGAKVLLFAHRLSRRKGAHYLPEIISGLKNENVVLVVIGDGPEREALNLQPTTYNLQQKVRILGWVPQNEILQYFFMADVFIMPSEEEGFPHVLLEAMAAGIPFVSFSVGGAKEISPPEFSHFIVTFGDKKSFINEVKEILHYSEDRIRQLSDIEQNWVKKFDLAAVIEEFKNLMYHNPNYGE